MNKETAEAIYEVLETIEEAFGHPSFSGNETLQQTVKKGRQTVTRTLEGVMGCSLTQRIDVDGLSDAEWLQTTVRIMGELEDPFQPQNAFDQEFLRILNYIWGTAYETLDANMKTNLESIQKQSPETFQNFVDYFEKYPLWGTLNPAQGDFDTFARRAAVLKRHSYDFLWLYRRLGDYLSRRTLSAILINWALLDMNYLTKVKSIFPDYWEPDLFPHNHDEVLVDVGAYTGDSILQYIGMYGDGYKKIYAYEISPESCEALRQNVQGYHDVEIRQKGVGFPVDGVEMLFLNSSKADASANRLDNEENGGEQIEVVSLDEDLVDGFTFLKMDIEGSEWEALWGSAKTITEKHPKLAISVYHGYDDLWRIPAMLDGLCPGYRFYLRHYGGNMIPTEFILFAKWGSAEA